MAQANPDQRLRKLDKLVGTWDLKHRDLESGREWGGQDTFEWLDGGHFMAFHHKEFGHDIAGVMILGYEKKWGEDAPSRELTGHWFESSTGNHWKYIWDVADDRVTFWLGARGAPSVFEGSFTADHKAVTGTWTWPGGGYELTMTRTSD